MADVELVIKIPTAIYEASQIFDVKHEDTIQIPLEVIANSIPLPKGHGRLGDLGKIYIELNEAQIEGTEEYKGLGKAKQIICNAKTIIEADRSEE